MGVGATTGLPKNDRHLWSTDLDLTIIIGSKPMSLALASLAFGWRTGVVATLREEFPDVPAFSSDEEFCWRSAAQAAFAIAETKQAC